MDIRQRRRLFGLSKKKIVGVRYGTIPYKSAGIERWNIVMRGSDGWSQILDGRDSILKALITQVMSPSLTGQGGHVFSGRDLFFLSTFAVLMSVNPLVVDVLVVGFIAALASVSVVAFPAFWTHTLLHNHCICFSGVVPIWPIVLQLSTLSHHVAAFLDGRSLLLGGSKCLVGQPDHSFRSQTLVYARSRNASLGTNKRR